MDGSCNGDGQWTTLDDDYNSDNAIEWSTIEWSTFTSSTAMACKREERNFFLLLRVFFFKFFFSFSRVGADLIL
jgi:hypothetical protein